MQDKEYEYMFILEAYATLSKCLDKHVAAMAVNTKGEIVSLSINEPSPLCTQHCKVCHCTGQPRHAEQGLQNVKGTTVYLNLFPCEDCQQFLKSNGCERVVVFGSQHKTNLGIIPITCKPSPLDYLSRLNSYREQQRVAAGELAEMITALMDEQRVDEKLLESNVTAEMVDVLIQLFLLKQPGLSDAWKDKIDKLNRRIQDGRLKRM